MQLVLIVEVMPNDIARNMYTDQHLDDLPAALVGL